MRTAFIRDAATNWPKRTSGSRSWSATSDSAWSSRSPRRFPERFVNAGVAEQNMTGLAAGLALSGQIVFTYSIANFPTLRCLEQIRNDVCYHRADVKIVAVGRRPRLRRAGHDASRDRGHRDHAGAARA